MSGACYLVLAALLLSCECSSASRRQKRIVGGERASPPPPGASEAEDEVVNPALTSTQATTKATTTTTRRPTTQRPADYDEGGPIVFLRRGRREARVKGRKDSDGVYSFQGLRYGQPPVGKLRFQRPRQTKLQGDVEATAPGPPCPQTLKQRIIGSEDCLFLNVYSPEIPKDSSDTDKKYPVLFWIHGGGFRRGSGSQYNPKDLVKKGLVVVTIQYRLGSLGFLSTNRKELPGNAGLFDIAASLRWVRHYIQFFGGDRNHIIPAGQGSGASAAQMLALNQYFKGWIKGVFTMSGTAISSFAVDKNPDETAKEVSAVDDCHTITDSLGFVRCMQKLPLDNIIKGDDKVQEGRLAKDNKAQSYLTSISKLLNPGPAVEGEDDERFLPNFLTATPQDIMQKGDFAKVPLLTGVTKHETSTSAKGGGIASQILGQIESSEELLQNIVSELLNKYTDHIGGKALNPLLSSLKSNNLLQLTKGVTSSLKPMANVLDKIIEVTTDALFNLPAFLTSQQWSKQSKAYLYSFEHNSSKSSADEFLKENPLTEQNHTANTEGVSHGDDLIYLFDVQPIEGGESVESTNLTDPEDMKVRDTFTDMVAEFARSGEPKLNGQSVSPFSTENGDYMVINSTPSVAKGFRKCQMGLWAGLADVLKSAECSSLQLGDVVKSLNLGGIGGLVGGDKGTGSGLGGLVGGDKSTGGLGGLVGGNKGTGGLGGLVGGNQSQKPKPSGGLLGGLG